MLNTRPNLRREDVKEKFEAEFPVWFRQKVILKPFFVNYTWLNHASHFINIEYRPCRIM